MPELYADGKIDSEAYYRSYVDTYLQRDICNLAQVADERNGILSLYNKPVAEILRDFSVRIP